MNVYISEIISEFNKNDENEFYTNSYSASFINLAKSIKKDFDLIVKLGNDKQSDNISEYLYHRYSKERLHIIRSPLLSTVSIDGFIAMRGSACASLNVEELEEILSSMDIDSVLISGSLLAVNPSANAIVDAVSFSSPKADVIVDLSLDATKYISLEILGSSLKALSSEMKTYSIGSVVNVPDVIQIELEHINEYLS